MIKRQEQFRQLIPGNPGTSYITCLLFSISKKYGIDISNEKQVEIFCKGMSLSRKSFFAKTLDEIATTFNLRPFGFTDNKYLQRSANDELRHFGAAFNYSTLRLGDLVEIVNKYKFVTVSVDIFYFNHFYHDYHFCCLCNKDNRYYLFEPKSGMTKLTDISEIGRIINSVRSGLSDAILVFCY